MIRKCDWINRPSGQNIQLLLQMKWKKKEQTLKKVHVEICNLAKKIFVPASVGLVISM